MRRVVPRDHRIPFACPRLRQGGHCPGGAAFLTSGPGMTGGSLHPRKGPDSMPRIALLVLLLSLGGGSLMSALWNVEKAGNSADPNGATTDAGGHFDPDGAMTDAGGSADPDG